MLENDPYHPSFFTLNIAMKGSVFHTIELNMQIWCRGIIMNTNLIRLFALQKALKAPLFFIFECKQEAPAKPMAKRFKNKKKQ